MSLICLELSHHTAPVSVREELAFADKTLKNIYDNVGRNPGFYGCEISELILISTCNRVELYAETSASPDGLRAALSQMLDVSEERFSPFLQYHVGEDAVHHLCRVACGLESQILGETQILGQVTKAHQIAIQFGSIGPILKQVFQIALQAGKRARTETAICRHASSISAVAVRLAKRRLGDLSRRHVALLGTGEMGQLTLKALQGQGVTQVSLLNRTLSKAESLAQQYHGEAYPMEALPQVLQTADVLITATGAQKAVLRKTQLEKILADRSKPLLIIDIAVPRDVEDEAKNLDGVALFSMDALRSHLDEALEERKRAIPQVEQIISEAMREFEEALKQLSVRPVITELYQKADKIRIAELDRLFKDMPDLEPETLDHIHQFSRSLVKKLLHAPSRQLRIEAENNNGQEYDKAVRTLFGL